MELATLANIWGLKFFRVTKPKAGNNDVNWGITNPVLGKSLAGETSKQDEETHMHVCTEQCLIDNPGDSSIEQLSFLQSLDQDGI